MPRKIIPDIVSNQTLFQLGAETPVVEAAKIMKKHNISAVIVVDDQGTIIGIFTERDVSSRVVADERNPRETPLSEVMTPMPDTLRPGDSPMEALDLMLSRKYRHLPVAENGKAVGMVSVRDLFSNVKSALEEDLKQKEAFIFGENYGG